MAVTVLIPAAGLGRRMGGDVSKQYLDLDGKPILAHTLALFDNHPLVADIWVICAADQVEFCRRDIVDKYGFVCVADVIAGGAERQESVYNGLLRCGCGADDLVVIHDGVRPLYDTISFDDVVRAAGFYDAAIVAVPVKDTVKQVEAGRVVATPPRHTLWAAQTPQVFRYDLIMHAHEQARRDGFCASDDAALLERLGQEVMVVEGSYSNIKITTPEDLLIAETVIHSRNTFDAYRPRL